MNATSFNAATTQKFRDYVIAVNAELARLGRHQIPLHLADLDNHLEDCWLNGVSVNECVVQRAYHAACRRADRTP